MIRRTPKWLRRLLLDIVLPAAAYGAATVYFTWPFAAVATTEIFDGSARGAAFAPAYRTDILHMIWILRWDLHALASDPLHLFDANIFHPTRLSLARSEYLLGGVPLFGAVWAPTQNPVLAFNCYMLASFVLAGFCMHVLVRRMTGSEAAAYTAGLAFAFAPWRIPDGLGRTQLLQVQYFPLILLTFDRAAASGRLRDGLLAAATLVLQALSSFYLAYQAFVVAGAFVLVDLAVRGLRGRRRELGVVVAALAVALAAAMAAALPHLALRARGELTVVEDALWRLTTVMGTPVRIILLYVGPGTFALAVLALACRSRAWATGWRGTHGRLVFLVIGVLGFVLARGPAPWLGDRFIPYQWLETLIPGFTNIRVPIRFGSLASFGASGLAGFAVADALGWLRKTTSSPFALAVPAIAGLVVLAPLASLPRLRGWPVPVGAAVPPVYRWLAAHGAARPLLELPMRGYTNMVNPLSIYFSTYHWLPLLNGYASYLPPSYRFVEESAARLPDPEALQQLVDCTGVGWILVHRVKPGDEPRWQTLAGIRLRAAFPRDSRNSDLLYDVVATPHAPCTVQGFGDRR